MKIDFFQKKMHSARTLQPDTPSAIVCWPMTAKDEWEVLQVNFGVKPKMSFSLDSISIKL